MIVDGTVRNKATVSIGLRRLKIPGNIEDVAKNSTPRRKFVKPNNVETMVRIVLVLEYGFPSDFLRTKKNQRISQQGITLKG
jgi:hypothetical protein